VSAPYNLTNRTFGGTFQTAAACASFSGLQADDRRLYWSCGSTAVVYDGKTRKNIPVPAGTDTLQPRDGRGPWLSEYGTVYVS
jgi:membrane-bound inhibitor of C-type lysozyme